MLRRRFLQTVSAAAATAAAGPAAAPAPDEVPIKLGFDTYSVRAFKWKAPQLLEYAAGLKLDTIQFSDLADYESHEPAYLQKIKDQAARLNIAVDGGMGCIGPLSKSFRKNGPPAREQLLEGPAHRRTTWAPRSCAATWAAMPTASGRRGSKPTWRAPSSCSNPCGPRRSTWA